MREAVSFLWELMLRHWTFYFMTRRIQGKLGKYTGCLVMQRAWEASRKEEGEVLPCSHPTPTLPTASIYPQPDKPRCVWGVTLLVQLSFPFLSLGWLSHRDFRSQGSALPPSYGWLFSGKSLPAFLSCHSKANHRGSLMGSNPRGGWGKP